MLNVPFDKKSPTGVSECVSNRVCGGGRKDIQSGKDMVEKDGYITINIYTTTYTTTANNTNGNESYFK